MISRTSLLVLLALALPCCGPGQRIEVRSEQPPAIDLSLGPADVFDVRVFGEPDLSSTYRVGPDGQINFPLVGLVSVPGKTTTQLSEELRKRLEQYVKNPQVSVLLKESNSKRVTVYGQVAHPGTLQYTDQMTISQAISVAGGVTAMAASDRTRVKRKRNGQTETVIVDLKAVSRGSETYYLQPGDEVFVPERLF